MMCIRYQTLLFCMMLSVNTKLVSIPVIEQAKQLNSHDGALVEANRILDKIIIEVISFKELDGLLPLPLVKTVTENEEVELLGNKIPPDRSSSLQVIWKEIKRFWLKSG